MRIDELTLENFGPFKGKHEIKFNNMDFFCIEGENGAGKSTIIDAIYFSLWGESLKGLDKGSLVFSTGNQSGNKRLDYSLILKFSVDNKNFEIVRSKKWSILKIGSKEFKGKEIERELNKVGLYKDIMKRSFIIKQGSFDMVLNSGKDEYRTPILNAVFGDLIEKMGDQIKEKLKSIKEEIDFNTRKIKEFGIEDYKSFDKKRIDEEIESKKKLIAECEERIKKIGEELEKNRAKEYKLRISLDYINDIVRRFEENRVLSENLEKKFKNFDILKNVYNYYIEYKEKTESLNKINKELKNISNEINLFKDKIELEEREKDSIIRKRDEVLKIYNDKKDVLTNSEQRIRDIEKEIKSLEERVSELKDEYELVNKQKNEKEREISELEINIKKYVSRVENNEKVLNNIREEIKKLEADFKKYNDFYEENRVKFEDFNQEYNKIKGKIEDYESEKKNNEKMLLKKLWEVFKIQTNDMIKDDFLKSVISKIENRVMLLEKEYFNFLGDEIAFSLKDGDICPVCGSVFHSHNRVFKNASVTVSQINSLKKEIDDLKIFKSDFIKGIEKIKECLEKISELENNKKQIVEKANLILVKVGVKKFSEVEEKIKNLRKVIDEKKIVYTEMEKEILNLKNELNLANSRVESLRKDLDEIQSRLNKLNIDIKECRDRKEDLDKEMRGKEEIINSFLNNIGFGSLNELKDWLFEKSLNLIEEKNKNIKTFFDEYNIKNTKLNTKTGEKNRILSEIDEVRTKIENIIRPTINSVDDLESMFTDIKEYENKIKEYDNIIKRYEINIDSINERTKELGISECNIEILNSERLKIEREIKDIEENLKSLKSEEKEYEFNKKSYEEEIEKLENKNKTVSDIVESLTCLEKDLNILSKLDKDFDSNNFPKYIAQQILKSIVEYVNGEILSNVLSGRYELIVDNEKDKIDVFDNILGSRRPSESLSGGERFLLSFILALGFSKIIGKRIGVFFIDEGFGTLDDNNRRLIVELFNDIKRMERGRQIGIITHMKDISSFFTQKIIVEKIGNGESRIKLIY